MHVYIAADHGGFHLKKNLIAWFTKSKYNVVDCGNSIFDPLDDYPDFAFKLADLVVKNTNSRGIIICRSGGGVVIAANKIKGIRAAVGTHPSDVEHNRDHNDINVLSIAGDYTSERDAKKLIQIFLTTNWKAESRMKRRLQKIKARER